jgi:hypothetical protein
MLMPFGSEPLKATVWAKSWRTASFVVYVIGANALLDLVWHIETIPRWGMILGVYLMFSLVRRVWRRNRRPSVSGEPERSQA